MSNEKTAFSFFSATSIKTSILTNFAGSFWQALMGLVFIPLYIKYIGIESYGLIGMFATLQVIFGILEVGLSGTLTREMARLSVLPDNKKEMRDLVRTMEIMYWCIAVIVGISIISLSPFIAYHWINAAKYSPIVVMQAFIIMGLNTVFQMPTGFYSGGLIGLQKQVLLNAVNICLNTLRGVGAVLVLLFISSTIQAFLIWQIGISIISVYLFAFLLWKNLPQSENKAVFQILLIKNVWRFTVGTAGISVLSIILTQLDKVILSKLLSLEMFGYYSLASLVAMNITRIFSPIFYSIYPRLTQLVSVNNQDELVHLYHKSCQLIAVVILPITAILSLFSYEVILLWTGNPITAEKTHLIVSVMVCGTALNGVMNIPYALQLAFGWTKLSVVKNIIAVIILAPLIIYFTMKYGAIGAASTWLALNLGYIILEIPVMHSRILRNEMWRWYWNDVSIPFMASISIASIGRIMVNGITTNYVLLIYLMVVSIATISSTIVVVPMVRKIVFQHIHKIRLYFA